MTEQELLDMFIQERINMLQSTLSKTRSQKTPEENERMIQAEQIIDNFTDPFASNKPYLSQQGFIDGIRTTNFFSKL